MYIKQEIVILKFCGDIRCFRDGQGRGIMIQDSPAAHNHYQHILVFYLYK